jgi:flagellar biosynthesis protein FlhG
LIVVSSGTSGAGTTCIATSLALALAQAGRRTVLVDADLDGAKATSLLQAQPVHSVADVLSGRILAREALVETCGSLRLLGGLWGSSLILDCPPAALQRLIEQLRVLDATDCVVIDVGSGRSHVVCDFWQAADLVVAVTTPHDTALLNTYSAIKVFGRNAQDENVHLVVNQAANHKVAGDVADRLIESAQRYLQRRIRHLGWMPYDAEVALACRERSPFLLRSADGPASQAIMQMAQALDAMLPRVGGEQRASAALVAA